MRLARWICILSVLIGLGVLASRTVLPSEQNGESWLQTSAATAFGTNLSTQTVVSSVPTTGILTVTIMPVVTTAGVGCVTGVQPYDWVDITMNWTAPGGTAESYTFMGAAGTFTLDVATNPRVDVGVWGPSLDTYFMASNGGWETYIVAKTGTAITYTASSQENGDSCTTVPEYTVFARASQ